MDTRLVARYLAGECSNAEEKRIEKWIESDPDNEELMDEFRRIWEVSERDNNKFEGYFDPAKDWNELRGRILDERRGEKVSGSSGFHFENYSTKTRFTQFMRVAAIIVVASLLGILAYQNLYQEKVEVEPVLREIAMEKGQRGNVTLSDGTKVTLNAESKIILPDVFQSDKREITLQGQAFFDVTHNPDRPFIINTKEATVEVLGTSLDVRSYPNEETVQVVVKEGRVSLKAKKECVEDDATLSAGEMGQFSLSENSISTQKVDDLDLFLSWRKGFLKFKDARMAEVSKELERKYDIQIQFRDEQLKDLRLTAELKSRTIQHNMDVISTSLGMKYQMDQQVVTFYRNEN